MLLHTIHAKKKKKQDLTTLLVAFTCEHTCIHSRTTRRGCGRRRVEHRKVKKKYENRNPDSILQLL